MHHAKNSTSTTAVILLGLTITAFALPSDNANDVFATAAVGVGLALLVATAIELSAGVRRLLRVDILMLWALYGLTLLEFLFPQPDVEVFITPLAAVSGTKAVLLGFASLSVGRHLVPGRSQSFQRLSSVRLRANDLFLLFVLATFVGYLHILVSVNFDLLEMLRQMSLPRFWQSWGRGKYGDLYSLLYECGMLINLIPPASGLIFARIKEFRQYQKIVVILVLALTVYYAFASGTRNVLVTYFLTFGGAYFLAKPKLTLGQVLGFGIPMLVVLSIATMAMLEFRGEGLSNFSLEFAPLRHSFHRC